MAHRQSLGHRLVTEVVASVHGLTVAQVQAQRKARKAQAMALAIAKHIPIHEARDFLPGRPAN